jgi:prefoldin subunit 5
MNEQAQYQEQLEKVQREVYMLRDAKKELEQLKKAIKNNRSNELTFLVTAQQNIISEQHAIIKTLYKMIYAT